MFKNLGLRSKLLFLCGTLLMVTVIVGGVSYWGITKMDTGLNNIVKVSLPNIEEANNMYLDYSQIRIALRTLGLPGLSKAEADASVEKVLAMIAAYEKENELYKASPFSPREKELYDVVDKDWTEFKAIGGKVLSLQKSGTEEDKKKMIEIFLKDCPEAAAKYDKSIKALVSYHQKNAAEWSAEALANASFVKQLQNFIMAFGVLGGLVIGYFFAQSISKLLHEISESLSDGSDKISTITGEISSASSSLSSSITQQAAALQQTTAAVEETSQSVVSNADNAKKSSEVSEFSKSSVQSGKHAVEEVMSSIDQIADSISKIKNEIDDSNKEIAGIVNIINEIGAKTKVINEIVFQTKLLSFNASVEAARAGDHGKGFAVVAEEVGNLAAMSGNSAREITELLTSSTEKVQQTIENSKGRIAVLMELSREKVDVGTITARKCNDVLDEITQNVNNVNMMISEISSASHEQSQSVREITKAMSEIDSASHQNSSSSQQTSAAALQLGNQVEDFRGLVVRLNTFIEGKKSA
ncbi:MAG: MCP four helix bundle domain-containing protein [Rhizobacter sp.]|nr:MCP four helix bundle domain-containing protein [Bacteriovorax sp.]